MELTKDFIEYDGKKYPIVDVELTEEDEELDLPGHFLFAASRLWDDILGENRDKPIPEYGPKDKEGEVINAKVYIFCDEVEEFHEGSMSKEHFKEFVAEELE